MDTRTTAPPAPEPEPIFGRSLAFSIGVHAALFAAASLVLGLSGGVRDGRSPVAVLVAGAEADRAWTAAAAEEAPPTELEVPEPETAEPEAVEVPFEATEVRPVPEPELDAAPLVDWDGALADALPLERIGRRDAGAEARPADSGAAAGAGAGGPALAAAMAPAPAAQRGTDRPLRLVAGPPPAYPRVALRLQQEGSVLLELEVDAAGRVSAARVVESSGFELLDAAAREAVLAWRFEPALSDGAPVAQSFRHRVQFVLQS